MTAPTVEQIAEVLRRCGTFQWVESGRGVPMGYYCRCGQRIGGSGLAAPRASWRTHQAEQVAALGVGDGEVEWAIRLTDDIGSDIYGFVGGRRIRSEADASTAAREDWAEGVARPVRRTVGPWVEVTDEGGEG